MKILYDYQALRMQRYGGVSRYYYELASRLRLEPDVQVAVPVLHSKNYYFQELLGTPMADDLPAPLERAVNLTNRAYTLLTRARYADILHPTYYNPYLVGRLRGRLVVTVHDFTHERFPECFPRGDATAANKARMIRAADALIAISENTRRDILQYFPEAEGKITTIRHGLGDEPVTPAPFPLPERYILFVGARQGYKNFTRFCEAMLRVMKNDDGVCVLCAGGGPFTPAETASFGRYAGRFLQRTCTDAELAHAYQNARCFVFPSLYEGFGLPTLEAFRGGCPVVLSAASCLPEIGGDAAEYIDPESAESIARAVERVLNNESLRREMAARGKARLQNYRWETTARETLRLYERIL